MVIKFLLGLIPFIRREAEEEKIAGHIENHAEESDALARLLMKRLREVFVANDSFFPNGVQYELVTVNGTAPVGKVLHRKKRTYFANLALAERIVEELFRRNLIPAEDQDYFKKYKKDLLDLLALKDQVDFYRREVFHRALGRKISLYIFVFYSQGAISIYQDKIFAVKEPFGLLGGEDDEET